MSIYVGFGCVHFTSKIDTASSMLITTLSMITVCLHIHRTVGVQDMNIFAGDIQNMTVRQSSTFMKNPTLFGPKNAIDRKDNYAIDTCGCCSVTNNPGQWSWWHIDLGQRYLIQGIQIYGRSTEHNDQLQNAFIYAGNTSLIQSQRDGVNIYTVPTMNDTTRNFTKILDEAIISQYFLVKLNHQHLTVCEFKLLQKECAVDRFGVGCSHICHCFDNKTCNTVTGECKTTECYAGWNGTACNQACSSGTFGRNCSQACSLHCYSSCNAVSGICNQGCKPGFMGPDCNTGCIKGTYGVNCSNKCIGHCMGGISNCNTVTGNCTSGCLAGYIGDKCDQACPVGLYGDGCDNRCHCNDGVDCLKNNGLCPDGCDFGWSGDNCSLDLNIFAEDRLNISVKQSSILINNRSLYGPENAIDRKESQAIDTCGCCSVTENNTQSWWQINLGQQQLIQAMQIYGRSSGCNDQLQNAVIYAGNTSLTQNQQDGLEIYTVPTMNATTRHFTKILDEAIISQYFLVKLNQGILTLCEFKLFRKESSEGSPLGSTVNTSAVAGGVVAGILVIVVVAVIFVLYKRKKGFSFGKQTERGNNGFSDISRPTRGMKPKKQQTSRENINHSYEAGTKFESEGGDYYGFGPGIGIKRHQLWSYIRDKMQNKCEEFYDEFAKMPYGLIHQCKDAKHPNNSGKNRYRGMYAYDHSRVKLVVTEPGEVDYINACYINGFDKVKKFVAAQGPWTNMVDDFWRLAWQINTDKIVMLTNLVEQGTTKCLQYWPDEGELYYGKVCVKLVRTESYLDYDVRHLNVSKNSESTRKIKQFHFKSWPDKDVPDSTWCLVNYWRAVDTNEATGAGPILVHCSAGVGRTGTFIALDNLVSQCKSEGSIRPLQMLQSLRDQRVNMVQTKEQYVYLHEAVADALFISTHHIWTKQFEEVYQFLLHNEKGDTEPRLEFQFNLIEKGIEETTPNIDNTVYSNVETLVKEGDAHIPRLQMTGAEIAPQLGAVYMPNYNGKDTFILTQSPANSTMDEILTLIDEHKIKTLLMLTDTSSPSYKDSCQLHIPNFGSRLIEEKTGDNVIEQTFSYKRTHQGDEKLSTIKQFRYTAWKKNRQVPDDTATFIEFLEAVLLWQSCASESQPILIHCGDGQNRSGLTYAVLNELFRINMDGQVNIVDTVTKMKQRRRQMIAGYEQYQYCCKFLLAYIKHTQIYSNI